MAIRFLDPKEADFFKEGINGDPEFRLASRFFSKDVLLVVGDSRCIVKFRDGEITEILPAPGPGDAWSFYIKGSAESWEKLQPVPPPFHNNLYPAMVRQVLEIGGDLEAAFGHFWPVSRMLDLMRDLQNR